MYTVNSIRALTLLLMISFIGFCQHVLGLQKALLAYNARTNARTVVGPSKLLKYPAAETTDLLHVDGQHIETMYNHTPTHKHTHPHTHTHTQTHTSSHTHTYKHTHTNINTHTGPMMQHCWQAQSCCASTFVRGSYTSESSASLCSNTRCVCLHVYVEFMYIHMHLYTRVYVMYT